MEWCLVNENLVGCYDSLEFSLFLYKHFQIISHLALTSQLLLADRIVII